MSASTETTGSELAGTGAAPAAGAEPALDEGLWGRERALSMLRESGFDAVEVHQLEHDIQNDYYVARPSAAGPA